MKQREELSRSLLTHFRERNLVVVKSLAANPDITLLQDYFSGFGKVDGLDFVDDPAISTNLEKNYSKAKGITGLPGTTDNRHEICLLTMATKTGKMNVLRKKLHTTSGIDLWCQDAMHLSPFEDQNNYHERKVILKQVPLDINERELKKTLESLCGRVEVFYIFRPDTAIVIQRRHLTCSVLFKNSKNVNQLVNAGYFSAPDGKPIVVRKYINDLRPTNSKATNTKKKSKEDLIGSSQSDFQVVNRLRKEGLSDETLNRYSSELQSSTNPKQDSELLDLNIGAGKKLAPALQTVQNSICSLSYYHDSKPTSRFYHNLRRLNKKMPRNLTLSTSGPNFSFGVGVPHFSPFRD